jgi:uncharacterized membrane protein YidH (DUF202 family)
MQQKNEQDRQFKIFHILFPIIACTAVFLTNHYTQFIKDSSAATLTVLLILSIFALIVDIYNYMRIRKQKNIREEKRDIRNDVLFWLFIGICIFIMLQSAE